MTPEQKPVTLITGEADQSALYAILGRLRNLGVALISILPQEGSDPGSPDQ